MAPMTQQKKGWEMTCACGFKLRDYNQTEFVGLVQTHVKTTHNQTMDAKAVMATAKPA